MITALIALSMALGISLFCNWAQARLNSAANRTIAEHEQAAQQFIDTTVKRVVHAVQTHHENETRDILRRRPELATSIRRN